MMYAYHRDLIRLRISVVTSTRGDTVLMDVHVGLGMMRDVTVGSHEFICDIVDVIAVRNSLMSNNHVLRGDTILCNVLAHV